MRIYQDLFYLLHKLTITASPPTGSIPDRLNALEKRALSAPVPDSIGDLMQAIEQRAADVGTVGSLAYLIEAISNLLADNLDVVLSTRPGRLQVLAFPATDTWVVPAGVTVAVVTAGGGGGGGGGGASGTNPGHRGRAAQVIERLPIVLVPGHTLAIAIGTGGGGGAADADGTTGGNTTITDTTADPDEVLVTAYGGARGRKGDADSGAFGEDGESSVLGRGGIGAGAAASGYGAGGAGGSASGGGGAGTAGYVVLTWQGT